MVVIRDVAARAGVSVASVSKVLNNKEIRITPERREAILTAAKELGYIPNRMASRLKRGRDNTVAILCPDLANPFYPKLARSLMFELEKLNHTCRVYDYSYDAPRCLQTAYSLRDSSVDGVILIPTGSLLENPMMGEMLDVFQSSSLPAILCNGGAVTEGWNCVSYDAKGGGRSMAEHLMQLGHTSFDVISGESEPFYLGFSAYVRERGGSITLWPHSPRYDGGYHAMEEIAAGKAASAVVAADDQLAIGAASYALQHGMRIPDELAITGVGDLIPGRIFPTPITTLRYATPTLAQYTVELLGKLLDGEEGNSELLIPRLLVRQSSVPQSSIPGMAGTHKGEAT